jgi:hypothetical protein
MGQHRRCGQRPREPLRRHGGGLDLRLALRVDDAVLHPRDDYPPHLAALPADLAALLETAPLSLSLSDQLLKDLVDELDAHLLQRQLPQVTPTPRLLLALGQGPAGRARRDLGRRPTAQRVERGQRGGELQLAERFSRDDFAALAVDLSEPKVLPIRAQKGGLIVQTSHLLVPRASRRQKKLNMRP